MRFVPQRILRWLTGLTDALGNSVSLSYDAAGNVIAQFGFAYDASGDITDETGVDEGITSLEGMLSLADMTYGPGNRLATYNGEATQFDADGNLTHGPLNGAMADFVYDSRRRLTQAGTAQYVYDAENNRIGVNGTRFVVNSQPALSQVLVKTEADGAQTFYVYGLGLIGEESAAGYKAYHFDFRGSTVALSDESGAVSARFAYSAYGVLLSGDVSQTPFLFNGMYGVMTDDNGLYHMRARFYSAEIRRFLNRDVLLGGVARGQSLNRFAFVTGRPVSLIDPFGLADVDVIDIFFDRGTHKVFLYNYYGEIILKCDAANNVTRSSRGPWPEGGHPYSHYNPHPESGVNDAYGSYGIYVFVVPGRSGMGLHSGRENRRGYLHPTFGCIRTTDSCMQNVQLLVEQGELGDIGVYDSSCGNAVIPQCDVPNNDPPVNGRSCPVCE